MIEISAVIITFNEERNIQRCLDSIIGIVDEIIVLDSFSTDNTKIICEKYNLNFIERKWEGYSASKNFANQIAKHHWILSLDADESLDPILANEILKLKNNISENTVYSLNRLTNYCGKWIYHSGWYPDIKIRLFEKNKINWIGEFVHEELQIPVNYKVIVLQGNLLHYSYYDKENHLERANKYSALTALKFSEKGKKASFIKPYFSAFSRFFSMFFIKLGFLDGISGFWIAWISAKSNVFKYKELRRLNKNK